MLSFFCSIKVTACWNKFKVWSNFSILIKKVEGLCEQVAQWTQTWLLVVDYIMRDLNVFNQRILLGIISCVSIKFQHQYKTNVDKNTWNLTTCWCIIQIINVKHDSYIKCKFQKSISSSYQNDVHKAPLLVSLILASFPPSLLLENMDEQDWVEKWLISRSHLRIGQVGEN